MRIPCDHRDEDQRPESRQVTQQREVDPPRLFARTVLGRLNFRQRRHPDRDRGQTEARGHGGDASDPGTMAEPRERRCHPRTDDQTRRNRCRRAPHRPGSRLSVGGFREKRLGDCDIGRAKTSKNAAEKNEPKVVAEGVDDEPVRREERADQEHGLSPDAVAQPAPPLGHQDLRHEHRGQDQSVEPAVCSECLGPELDIHDHHPKSEQVEEDRDQYRNLAPAHAPNLPEPGKLGLQEYFVLHL